MDASSSTTSTVYRGLLWEEGRMRQVDAPGDTKTHRGTRGRSEWDTQTHGGGHKDVWGGTHVQVHGTDTQTHRTHSVASSLPVSRFSLTAASSQRWQKR